MSMSKKDYETIADVLTTCEDDRNDTILQLAWRFAQENRSFRWDMFLEACDYNGDYKIGRFGQIVSPGKFEGEACYMPKAYEADGDLDEENGVFTVYLRWGGNEDFHVVYVEEEQGFVTEIVCDDIEVPDA